MQISLKTWVTKFTPNRFQIVGKVTNGAELGNLCDIPRFGSTAVVQNVEVTRGIPCTASSTPSETIIHSHIRANSIPYVTRPVEAYSQGGSLVCSHILHYSSSAKCENNMENSCYCVSWQTQVIRFTWNLNQIVDKDCTDTEPGSLCVVSIFSTIAVVQNVKITWENPWNCLNLPCLDLFSNQNSPLLIHIPCKPVGTKL